MTVIQIGRAARLRQANAKLLEVDINGRIFEARIPSTMQAMIFGASLAGGMDTDNLTSLEWLEGIYGFVRNTLGEEAEAFVREEVDAGNLEMEDLIGGEVDGEEIDGIFSTLMEAASGGRPTEPSSNSASSSTPRGKRSTGRSPGKGSTRSTSRSTDS